MRYFWALLAYVAAIVVTAASCGGTGKGNGFSNSNGTGGDGSTASANGGGGSHNSNNGGGGSSGVFMTGDSGPPEGGTCPAFKGDCMQQGLDCGMATDGCGNTLDCGSTCADPKDSCGGSGTQNVCGHPMCTAATCTSLGFDCGMTSDNCGGTLDCGTCSGTQSCGVNMPNVCGTGGSCTPKTCAQQGFNCGMQGDTCGNALNCGTCSGTQTCGGGSNPMNGVCGGVTCTPKTCAQQGFNCGAATDGCGNIIMCGTCSGTQTCGAASSNVCGTSITCTNLCLKQTVCSGTATTSISGTVFAPNGTDPLYNTLVYVPNSAVQPFVDGVSVPHCSCGSDVSGTPLVSTATGVDGKFTLTNMPVGTNIPVVFQNGRWRRQITVSNVPRLRQHAAHGCPDAHAHQATNEAEFNANDNIPLMGFVTGSVDALECVLRKIGIADNQFTNRAAPAASASTRATASRAR